MKVAVVILVLLGLLAAGAAMVVVQMIATTPKAKAAPMATVLQATSVLPALTTLKTEHLSEAKVPATGLPQRYLSSPAQAIGKILRIPVEEGQVLTPDYFIPEGTASDMIRLIPPGMRAYSIVLQSSSVNKYLLYPGSTVDIYVIFRLSRSAKGEAMAMTYLQNMQIVAIESETVLSAEGPQANVKKPTRGNSFVVTFKATPEEAKALELARRYGRIAIALRNPTDTASESVAGMVLNQGQLTEWAQDLDPGQLLEAMRANNMIIPDGETPLEGGREPNAPLAAAPSSPPTVAAPEIAPEQTRRMNWKVFLYEGAKPAKELEFSLEGKKENIE